MNLQSVMACWTHTFILWLVTMATYTCSMHIAQTFRDPFGHQLQQMAVNTMTGEIIVGATNSFVKLSSDLELIQRTSVKVNDSVIFNKGIAINSLKHEFISCYSNSGLCDIRSADDLNVIKHMSRFQIVPKDRNSNSLVFISSPLNDPQIHIMNDGPGAVDYKDRLPAISSRRVSDFELLNHNFICKTAKRFIPSLPSEYNVQYIYGFSNENFIYFLATQPKSFTKKTLVTKLVRICRDDKYYRSYVETQLDCLANVESQFTVATAAYFDSGVSRLYVGFTGSTHPNSAHSSALCVFNLHDMDRRLDKVIQDCYHGNGTIGPAHFHRLQSCIKTSATPDYCGQSDVSEAYMSIEGQAPIFERLAMEFPDTQITAVTARIEDKYVAVYIGTSKGSLKKVISDNRFYSLVGEVDLDPGSKVKPTMFLNGDGTSLYAMTLAKVMKINVDHCAEKTTCQECNSRPDPVCGWCILTHRCTIIASCPSEAVSPAWLPSRDGVCVEMRDVQPNILSYSSLSDSQSDKQVTFRLDKISVLDPDKIDLHCSFVTTATKEKTRATIIDNRISCPFPPSAKLPPLPQGQVLETRDHSRLEVEFQIAGRSIVKRDVSLYDCQLNQNCTDCTESQFDCKWCHIRGMCLDYSVSGCPDQANRIAPIMNSGSCPRLETAAQQTDILVHSGQTRKIALRATNIKRDQLQSTIHCLFTYLGDVKVVPATISSSNLLCDELQFGFNKTQWPIVTARLTVTAGQYSVPLDNPQNIRVRIYKCDQMVTNCGQCLSMDAEYECGWCGGSEPHCSLQADCPADDWLDRAATCPNPLILRFSPGSGPIMGRTNISVTGINLGKSHSDLEVTAAGVKCEVHPQHYNPSLQFSCEVDGPDAVKDGVIRVKVNRQYTTKSDGRFHFVDPTVSGLSPKAGPMAGGTAITISGSAMNAGTTTTVDVGGSPCQVTRSNESVLVCVTSQQMANENQVYVEVNFGNHRKLVPQKFNYKKDPEISMIEPKKTILSGGTAITAMGNRMQYIQNPEFFIDVNGQKSFTSCAIQPLTTWLICRTPRLVLTDTDNVTETSPKEVHYGFNLDGVTKYRNISEDPAFGPLLYFPNPNVERYPAPGDGMRKFQKDQKMVIKGEFQSLSPVMQDVLVYVGGTHCDKPMASDDTITCTPPNQPREVNGDGNAAVVLKIGNLKVGVGYVNYYTLEEVDKPIAIGIILGVVLPILAIIGLLAFCVIRRHRRHKPSDNYIPDVWKDTDGQGNEEEMGDMNHVAVKADMNNSIPSDTETGPYIQMLLDKIPDAAIKQTVSEFLIKRRRLDIGDLLGKGNFGVTCKATYSKTDEEIPTDIAVKTLQGTQTDVDSVTAFLTTMAQYCHLQHPGLAPLHGVCLTVADDPMVILPYCQNGDLKSYVRDSNRNVTVLELLDMAVQIAEAMDYMHSVHLVHGNLAARNCLVTDQRKVQVSEYGLTKDLFSKSQYYIDNGKAKHLVKWASPEVVQTAEFTPKSDVWAYGVVLWELLTRGVTPYPDVDNADLQGYLETGNRMKKPRQCPENIYELMLLCWSEDPDKRPTFRQIADDIQACLSSTEDQDGGENIPLKSNIDVSTKGEFI